MRNKVSHIITEKHKEDTILSEKMVKVIAKACGYTFQEKIVRNIICFTHSERFNYIDIKINLPITLEGLMMKIIDGEKSNSYRIGHTDKQNEIKKALNI